MKKSLLWKLVILIFLCSVLAGFLFRRESPLEVGEELLYHVSGGGTGSFTLQVVRENYFRGEKCYQINFKLSMENFEKAGTFLVNGKGELRYYRVGSTVAEVWRQLGLLGIAMGQGENWISLPKNLSTPEHLLILLRFQDLERKYGEFNFLSFSPPGIYPGSYTVVGEEKAEVPAGSADCWVLQLEGWKARMWVTKSEKVVAKFTEDNLNYELAQRRFWGA
ncbi:MAG: hypothetical protein QW356_03350 [Candidatus Hadarchaeales archaeon]